MSSAILAVLKEDKHKVSYRPRFAALTDCIEAAVLLEDVIYWWGKMGEKPYYKFREPCDHKLYKRSESWCEELGFNLYEYNKALTIIATKITKGVSKKDAMAFNSVPTRQEDETDEQFLARMQGAVQHLVIYWTDASNTTWFWLNEILLEEFVHRIYLEEFEGIRSLRKLILGRTRKGRKSTSHKDSSSTTQALHKEREDAPEPELVVEPEKDLSPSKPEIQEAQLHIDRDVTTTPMSIIRGMANDLPPRPQFNDTMAYIAEQAKAQPLLDAYKRIMAENTPDDLYRNKGYRGKACHLVDKGVDAARIERETLALKSTNKNSFFAVYDKILADDAKAAAPAQSAPGVRNDGRKYFIGLDENHEPILADKPA